MHLRIVNERQVVTFFYSLDGEAWTRHGVRSEVAGYNANTIDDLQSLRPALFAAGAGSACFSRFTCRGLDEHGSPLRRAKDRERAARFEPGSLVGNPAELAVVGEQPALLVHHQRIVIPTALVILHDLNELIGPVIPLVCCSIEA